MQGLGDGRELFSSIVCNFAKHGRMSTGNALSRTEKCHFMIERRHKKSKLFNFFKLEPLRVIYP